VLQRWASLAVAPLSGLTPSRRSRSSPRTRSRLWLDGGCRAPGTWRSNARRCGTETRCHRTYCVPSGACRRPWRSPCSLATATGTVREGGGGGGVRAISSAGLRPCSGGEPD
jgi:hypothetical protein